MAKLMLENTENVMSPALKDTYETHITQTLTYNKYASGSD